MKYKTSLVIKTISLVIMTLIIFNTLSSYIIYKRVKKEAETQIHEQIRATLHGIGANINGDALQVLIETGDETDPYYQELQRYLGKCLAKGAFKYLYTIGRFEDGQFYYVVDSLVSDSPDFSAFKTPLEIEESIGTQVETYALETGEGFTSMQYYEEWGYLLTGYVAIYNTKGEAVALLGVDVTDADYAQKTTGLSRSIWVILQLTLVGTSMVLGVYLARALRPLRQVSDKARQIAGGDLTLVLENNRKDEIGQTLGAFSKMISVIKTMISKISEYAKGLGMAAKQLVLQSQQLREASERMSEQALGIGEYAQKTQRSFAQVTRKVEEISKGIDVMANQMMYVDDAAGESYRIAKDGERVVGVVLEQMRKSYHEMLRTGDEVNKLMIYVKQVDRLIEQIGRIASQTRTLAFNASLEAAKKKESGKGFDVIAKEIERLAQRSAVFAQETVGILEGMRTQTSQVVGHVETNSQTIAQNTAQAEQMLQKFQEIVSHSLGITERIHEMNTLTKEYVLQIRETGKGVKGVSLLAEGLLARSEEMMAVSEEQLGGAQELLGCAESLSDIASELEECVDYFRLTKE
ncbi:MAG: methyl-accepting chemotaxis protein [Cellulosilyticaceae bacterium]